MAPGATTVLICNIASNYNTSMRRGKRSPIPLRRLGHAQVESLVSPIRQEIVDALTAAGPSTVAQLSKWVGVPADRLYYHLAALVRVGLLVERDRVRTGRRFGAVYGLAETTPAARATDLAGPSLLARAVQTSLRLAARDAARCVADPSIRHEGPARDLSGGRVKGWLTDAELQTFLARLEHAVAILRAGTPRPGTRSRALTYVFAPTDLRPRPTTRKARP